MGKRSSELLFFRTVIAHFDWRVHGCFTIICQTDRSQISGNTQRKWNDLVPLTIDLRQLDKLSLIRAKNRFSR